MHRRLRATLLAILPLAGCVAVLAHPGPAEHGYEEHCPHHGCAVPPGHLPPPGPCEELAYEVPRGACLIHGE